MEEMDKKTLTEQEAGFAAGGIKLQEKKAKVYTHWGEPIKMYRTPYEGEPPAKEIPNGSEIVVDPTLYPEQEFFGKKQYAYYWALHNHWWLAILDKEVTIVWL